MSDGLWNVAVDAPLTAALTYKARPEMELVRGLRVAVPLGSRTATGVILGPAEQTSEPKFAIKEIDSIDPHYPVLPAAYMDWAEWLSRYYHFPLGVITELFYPSLLPSEKVRGGRKKGPIPEIADFVPKQLSVGQKQIAENISAIQGFSTHLIFGVTGSGKTEVYLEIFAKVLAEGKSGLFLVPEISLTPQLIRRFAERFPDQVATLHSQLTAREKTEQWWSMINGRAKILVGARSALFCPLANLGLIVVDEEHEASYKQDEKLKYHGRDAAIVLAKKLGCAVVLGSATPSLETWKNCQDKKYFLHELPMRFAERPQPTIEIIDLKLEKKDPARPDWMSLTLEQGLRQNFAQGYQSALFINRRGVSSSVACVKCGESPVCKDCDIHLSLHGRNHLVCHYCNYHLTYNEDCEKCDGAVLPVGVGTEKIETDLVRLFPEARIARADRDEIQNRQDMEDLILKMEAGEIDILVGTQMISKGLDFQRLKFVGLVLADVGFNLPDFRATERSFQLITQMSGRAGRHVKPGEAAGHVVIQTLNPDHPALEFAPTHNYEAFAKLEISQRESLNYPPFHRLALVRLQGTVEQEVVAGCKSIRKNLEALALKNPQMQIEILGPAPAPLARIKRKFRYHLLLKGDSVANLQYFCQRTLALQGGLGHRVKVSVDVDPLQLL